MNQHNAGAIPIILLIRCIDKYLILYNSQMHNMYFSLLFVLKSYTSAYKNPGFYMLSNCLKSTI